MFSIWVTLFCLKRIVNFCFFSQQENPVKPQQPVSTNGSSTVGQVKTNEDISKTISGHMTSGQMSSGQTNSGQLNSGNTGNESPDDQEKEERRRAAQKVFGKQG
jgi:hypothetical protein